MCCVLYTVFVQNAGSGRYKADGALQWDSWNGRRDIRDISRTYDGGGALGVYPVHGEYFMGADDAACRICDFLWKGREAPGISRPAGKEKPAAPWPVSVYRILCMADFTEMRAAEGRVK